MQLPNIKLVDLETTNTQSLQQIRDWFNQMKTQATNETEHGVWEITIAGIEIELWSRGYEPTP